METNKNIISLSSEDASLAKIIATFSVVLTHSYKLFGYMSVDKSDIFFLRGVHAFAACGVPVFFLLSGYFLVFKDNWNYSINMEKKFKSLVIPYVVFMMIYTIISCIGSFVLPDFFDDFRTFSLSDWVLHVFGIPFVIAPSYYGPLWFIRELMIFNVLSIVLVPLVKKIPGYILIPLALVLYFLPISQIIRYSIPFFIVGMYFGFNKKIPVFNIFLFIVFLFICAFSVPIVFEGEIAWKISVLLMAVFIMMVAEKLIEMQRIKKLPKLQCRLVSQYIYYMNIQ